MSRFVISCGGTGGHLSPGIALAEGLRARGHETTLLISRKQIDARLSAKYPHLKFAPMPGRGWAWHPVAIARFVPAQLRALWFCLRLLRTVRPAAVIGFGGFTSASPLLVAALLGIPAALHESNRVPGRAVRLLGRLARRVYLPLGIAIAGIGGGATRHAGLPVRREITRHDPAAARAALGLEPQRRTLVVLGGSQGASALNTWVRAEHAALARAGVQLFVVTGPGKGAAETLTCPAADGAPVRAIFEPFSDRMAELMSAADLVVSRAGAGTLAELIRCGAPAVLVPYPKAADDHQRANAEHFAREGGGVVVAQTELVRLTGVVLALLGSEAGLEKLRAALRRMDRADPLELMLTDLEEIAAGERRLNGGAWVMAA
ncbi:MAG: UDP-N-acetylglucosamine--N-acetylmuramyl-(pentapeptide) pyrophosphoryl-undecaprenol N-acetylglucosamine transferase [Opitutaceae bacterium]|nr:UDP-N-acetylglucosamine--N-acetylmuramyl-(pentapeptide) pyrophosphoryl-undecaprenol N-acetylglucosamine transferase [Opitutaceae bacterium]